MKAVRREERSWRQKPARSRRPDALRPKPPRDRSGKPATPRSAGRKSRRGTCRGGRRTLPRGGGKSEQKLSPRRSWKASRRPPSTRPMSPRSVWPPPRSMKTPFDSGANCSETARRGTAQLGMGPAPLPLRAGHGNVHGGPADRSLGARCRWSAFALWRLERDRADLAAGRRRPTAGSAPRSHQRHPRRGVFARRPARRYGEQRPGGRLSASLGRGHRPAGEASGRSRRRVTSVAFSDDGRRLLSGSFDNTARLWACRRAASPCRCSPVTTGGFGRRPSRRRYAPGAGTSSPPARTVPCSSGPPMARRYGPFSVTAEAEQMPVYAATFSPRRSTGGDRRPGWPGADLDAAHVGAVRLSTSDRDGSRRPQNTVALDRHKRGRAQPRLFERRPAADQRQPR